VKHKKTNTWLCTTCK